MGLECFWRMGFLGDEIFDELSGDLVGGALRSDRETG